MPDPNEFFRLTTKTSRQAPLARWFDGEWHVWLAYDVNYTQGTYLTLHRDGRITRNTLDADGTTRTVQLWS